MLYDPKWTAPFKTAEELGLRQDEFEALVGALALLSSEQMPPRHTFHMSDWYCPTFLSTPAEDCGTACCIGGLASFLLKERNGANTLVHFSVAASRPTKTASSLNALFYPSHIDDWSKITMRHGAAALRNYLTYGEPRWSEVMA